MTDERKPFSESKKASYIGAPKVFALEAACRLVNEAFGNFGCYLVGSALERPDWRDVDVRFIMADADFKVLFPRAYNTHARWEHDPRWLLINTAIAEYLSRLSGLPIDFQIQPQDFANEKHKKTRSAIGLHLIARSEDSAEAERPASGSTPEQRATHIVRELYNLVKDGILVRNTSDDADFSKFASASMRLCAVLVEAEKILVGSTGSVTGSGANRSAEVRDHMPAKAAAAPEASPSPYKGAINIPCSACSAGDDAMEYHDHEHVKPENRTEASPFPQVLIARLEFELSAAHTATNNVGKIAEVWLRRADKAEAELQKVRRELEHFEKSGIVEVAVRNPQVAEYCKHWEERAEAAEQRLQQLQEAVQSLLDIGKRDLTNPKYDGYFDTLRELLALPSAPEKSK